VNTVQTFHTPTPPELEIRVPVGRIDIETIDGEESTVSVEGADKLVEQTAIELIGNRLSVKFRKKLFWGADFGRTHLDVRVRVPHSTAVLISTASAGSKLRGRFGSVSAKSASGDLVVDGEVEGDTDVRNVSGNLQVGTVGGELVAQTVSGNIAAGAVAGNVTAKSVSGNVRVDSAREGTFNAQSVSGDIAVGVPEGTNLDVDAASASGKLTSEVPLLAEPATLAGGPLLIVRGNSVSGDFRLFRAA
jgi:Toastrack DUF4097